MTDKIIIGAGLYGLYAALYCARKGQAVTVLEREDAPFRKATYINQARVHMGYHYPRSLSTAMKSAGYFRRFVEDYKFCIHSDFQQIYATSSHFSWTDAAEFRKFCRDAGIPCTDLPVDLYFKEGVCDGAFLTKEYTYDAHILRDYFLEELGRFPQVTLLFQQKIQRIVKSGAVFEVYTESGGAQRRLEAPFVLNAAYASVNQVLDLAEDLRAEHFGLKYELCEIILCRAGEKLKNIGFTVMDGPFFSIMPFGKTGFHSLTSVTFTPHKTSYETTPRFGCQEGNAAGGREGQNPRTDSAGEPDGMQEKDGEPGGMQEKGGEPGGMQEKDGVPGITQEKDSVPGCTMDGCTAGMLGNCNDCKHRPESAWEYMSALARKYIRDEYSFSYEKSLFSMKPILKASEIDDSRPTVIRFASREPVFQSVLSGKINTVYDLDEFLD